MIIHKDSLIANSLFTKPTNFRALLVSKLLKSNGKFSYIKIGMLVLTIGYAAIQPLYVLQVALAASLASYMINNFTKSVMDAAVEAETI